MRKIVFTLVFAVCSVAYLKATEVTTYSTLYATWTSATSSCSTCSTSVMIADSLWVQDPLAPYYWADAFSLQSNMKYYSVKDVIELGIDWTKEYYYEDDFTVELTGDVTYWDETDSVTPVGTAVCTLTVDYIKSAGVTVKSVDNFVFAKGLRFSLKNVDLNFYELHTTTPLGYEPKNVYVTGYIIAEQYRDVLSLTQPTNTSVSVTNTTDDRHDVSWTANLAAEEYDLEWLFFSEFDQSEYYNFKNNSTRIRTKNTSYSIPRIYEEGTVLVRVRPVGRNIDNPDEIIYGTWSLAETAVFSSTLSTLSGLSCSGCTKSHFLINDGHEPLKNWQYSVSFAEEGRKKEVISYFDGTQRKRQTLTRNNTDDKAIVSSTIYDGQGRPAVETLPVPADGSDDNTLFYKDTFNLSQADPDREYNYTDFDLDDTDPCLSPVGGMHNSSGSSNYYSDENDDLSDEGAYLPDANLFPFVQTEYTPDNTGRIRAKSGAGQDHIMGSGHETKYYYSTPAQPQLDRLFANDAGYSEHYLKEAVMDPNGTISITYKNPAGKVIATSLAGDPSATSALVPLDSSSFSQVLNVNLLNNNVADSTTGTITAIYTHFVASAGEHSFEYTLERPTMTGICVPEGVCYDCVYDLEINIFDECGALVATTPDSIPAKKLVGEIDTICDEELSFTLAPSALTCTLGVGTYTIVKTLTISDSVAQYYLQNFLENDTCINTYEDFLEDAIANTDFSGCDISCDSCLARLGEYADHSNPDKADPTNLAEFDPDYIYMAYEQYQADSISCTRLCLDGISPCEATFMVLKNDVSPGGQYAPFETADGDIVMGSDGLPVIDTDNPYSIFYTGGSPNLAANFTDFQEGIAALYEDGEITVAGITYDIASLNAQEFVNVWQQEWADSLVLAHPEYCYYQFCLGNEDSYRYDRDFANTETFDEADDKGYLTPLNNADFIGSYGFNEEAGDPFFMGGSPTGNFAAMEDDMEDFPFVLNSSVYTIWQLAYMIYNHTDEAPSSPPSCTGDNYWPVFKGLYMALKSIAVRDVMLDIADCPNISGTFDFDNTTYSINRRYFQTMTLEEQLGELGYSQDLIDDVIADPQTEESMQDIQNQIAALMTEHYQGQCEGYAVAWLGALLPCKPELMSDNDWNELTEPLVAELVEICTNGSDEFNPFGASSAPTASANGNFTFEEALADFLEAEEIELSDDCNPSVISYPSAYGHSYSSAVLLNECNCYTILETYYDYFYERLGPLPEGVCTASDYFAYVYGPTGNDFIDIEQTVEDCMLATPIPDGYEEPDEIPCDSFITFVLQWHEGALLDSLVELIDGGFEDDANTYFGVSLQSWQYLNKIKICFGGYDSIGYLPNVVALQGMQGFFNELIGNSALVTDAEDVDGYGNIDFYTDVYPTYSGCDIDYMSTDFLPGIEHDTATTTFVYQPNANDSISFSWSYPLYFYGGETLTFFTTAWSDQAITHLDYGFINFTGGSVEGDSLFWQNLSANTSATYPVTINTGGISSCEDSLVFYLFATGFNGFLDTVNIRVAIPNVNYDVSCDHFGEILDISFIVTCAAAPDTFPCIQLVKPDTIAWEDIDEFTGIQLVGNYDELPVEDWIDNFLSQDMSPYFSIVAVIGSDSITLYGGSSCIPLGGEFGFDFDYTPTQVPEVVAEACSQCADCGDFLGAWAGFLESIGQPFMPSDPDAPLFNSDYAASLANYINALGNLNITELDVLRMAENCFSTANDSIHELVPDFFAYMNDILAGAADEYNTTISLEDEPYLSQLLALGYADDPGVCHPETQVMSFSNMYIPDFGITSSGIILNSVDECDMYETFALLFDPTLSPADVISIIDIIDVLQTGEDEDDKTICRVRIELTGADTISGIFVSDLAIAYANIDTNITLCHEALFAEELPDSSCYDYLMELAEGNARGAYNSYIEGVSHEFLADYRSTCMAAVDTFNMEYTDKEYHFTLYYYDQAGNLVKTVPPNGVKMVDLDTYQQVIDDYRNGVIGTRYETSHTFNSNYVVNTLNQVTTEITPDAGTKRIWYDRLGRPVLSQTAQQYAENAFTHTSYDELGRPDMVERVEFNGTLPTPWPPTVANTWDEDALESWAYSGDDPQSTEQIATAYDVPTLRVPGFVQENLRGRVASVVKNDFGFYFPNVRYDFATHYSYDIHGNVKSLVQESPNGDAFGEDLRYFRMDYEYDLISGNVKQVWYRRGKPDQFTHKYVYDTDNRLSEVFTSTDGVIWHNDAEYDYYKHGPLARTELGDIKVQGSDYAYTIQGWMKAVNAASLNSSRDMGLDGETHLSAKDAMGFTLGYYNGDYTGIGGSSFEPALTSTDDFYNAVLNNPSTAPGLFNGNITRMVTALLDTDHVRMPVAGNAYQYDQLNRIKEKSVFLNPDMHLDAGTFANTWEDIDEAVEYYESFKYDPNGNILGLLRKGEAGNVNMDSLVYFYESGKNRLNYVTDTVDAGNYPDDIDNQSANNYQYDLDGNLAKDVAEGIDTIKWNNFGKVEKIDYSDGKEIRFIYDAMGNRLVKFVVPAAATPTLQTYIRDAQGNVMATYDLQLNGMFIETHLKELMIYGSSRIGILAKDTLLDQVTEFPETSAADTLSEISFENIFVPDTVEAWIDDPFDTAGYEVYIPKVYGYKNYELSNHLGNVLSVVTDRKVPIEDSTAADTVGYYEPWVLSVTDYYSYGSPLPGRTINEDEYSYGMNGQERVSEIAKGHYTAEHWEYDSRLGPNGRWNTDPVVNPSISPYVTFENNPILLKDPLGDSPFGPDGPKKAKRKQNRERLTLDNFNGNHVSLSEANVRSTKTFKKGSIFVRGGSNIDGPDIFKIYHGETLLKVIKAEPELPDNPTGLFPEKGYFTSSIEIPFGTNEKFGDANSPSEDITITAESTNPEGLGGFGIYAEVEGEMIKSSKPKEMDDALKRKMEKTKEKDLVKRKEKLEKQLKKESRQLRKNLK